jgi:hypothetical protein
MEGFVHQTKGRRLEDIRDSLRRAYESDALIASELFHDQLNRLEAAEREAKQSDR